MKYLSIPLFASLLVWISCTPESNVTPKTPAGDSVSADSLRYPEERHLRNVKRLTPGGNNAEAYFSFDNQSLTFQSDYSGWGYKCDQIVVMNVNGALSGKPAQISTGKGRTTCSYFLPGNKQVLFASTHLVHDTCPPVPERRVDGHYVWPIYKEYDIFIADLSGNIQKQLTDSPGYDAEATVSPDGKKIVFTSMRSGDLELWTMNIDGTGLKQITNGLGYDGGAFFSPDGSKLVFRASRPKTAEEQATYKALLAKGLVEPGALEIFICNADGSEMKQITNLGRANWAPFFHPSGNKVVFASNHASESGRQFNLFMMNVDGSDLEQITFDKVFDSFPMFSFDGKKIVFASNRFNGGGHDTNIFIADWVD